ncbi:hypothetical protein EYF88_01085 [Paracoccus sediminis]|uniref:Sulfotransferase family protein n=1 Tax=Paracoccus sediminis TaxID=1214787 RepID=A0A238UT77_9RHOB|nr:hypothetical protein [Paracoccus sediminis]TBN52832.1 hypothetical protein EYF88_01085 [Paracoccus sediminis]SNR25370.1 hypothetical protein SAMN06265378_101404 [Paracoccus sediminis]
MAGVEKGQGARRLIVHLGVQKTGSTAIQRHLRRNADALAGHLVIRTPEEGSPMRPLGRAAIGYSLAPDADRAQALRLAFRAVLDTLPGKGLPVLVSHENLAGAMPGNGGETRLYPALPQIAALLMAEAQDFAVDFVVYTRNQKAWRPSVWAQAVRTDGYRRSLVEFEAETADLPGWGDLIRRLGAQVGVTRFKLEDEMHPTRPGRQLLRHVGLADALIDTLEPLDGPANSRLNGGATEFLRRLNGLSLNPNAHGKVVDLVARTGHLFTAQAEGTS